MVQEQFRPKLHSPQPDHPTWARCGKFTSGVQMAPSDDKVSCGHCMRKLGYNPELAVTETLDALFNAYHLDLTPATIWNRVKALMEAEDARRRYVAGRRYYR